MSNGTVFSESSKVSVGIIGALITGLFMLLASAAGILVWGTKLEARVTEHSKVIEDQVEETEAYRLRQGERYLQLQTDVTKILVKLSVIEQQLQGLGRR